MISISKKSIASFIAVAVITFGVVAPAFAQDQQPGQQGNFFGMFAQMFSRFFQRGQVQNQNVQGDENFPTGMPTGQPGNLEQADEERLNGLVTAGKITQAQAQQILTEISTIKTEIQTWSSSTGINAAYIYDGLRGPMMSPGIGNGTQGAPVVITGMPIKPTGGNFENGGNQGGRIPGPGGMMGPR